MKKKYFLIIIVLVFCSCQKEFSKEGSNTNTNANTNTSTQVDVYVAGYVSNYSDTYNDIGYPTYWKNGNPVKIDSDLPNTDYGYVGGRAVSIAVSGSDVYVSGIGRSIGPYRESYAGLFWKNNIREVFNVEELTSLKVSNSDIYAVGFRSGVWGTGDPATYYKNGDPIDILDGSAGSDATSIAVSGNDVYVAGVSITGSVYNGPQHLFAKYWKNGNPVKLTDGTKNAYASSIAVSGTDVYVAGFEYNGSFSIAKYWKNGNLVKNLTDGSTDAEANSIAVSGNDIYVGGTQWDGNKITNANGNTYRNPIAKYWKNGNPVNLTDGSRWAEAKSIVVTGNDVYIAGFEETEAGSGNYIAKYWKNGTPVILGDVSKNSKAYSIFLAKR